MRARYYNTDIKRFINRDTVSGDLTNSQSLNKYSYVQGNPVSLTDPFGLSPMGGDVMSILSQLGHTALAIGGFFWDGFDLINAVWYAAEGNTLMAMSCGVAAIPFLGSVASKGVSKIAFKVLKSADKASDLVKAAKLSKAAGYINDISKLVGYTGMATLGAIDTAYAYQDYKAAKANGEDATLELCSVILNGAFTVCSGIRAVSSAAKVTARLKADGVGDAVKAAVKNALSNNKGCASMEPFFGKGKSSKSGVDFKPASYYEYKALRQQGYNATEAFNLQKQFRSGINPDNKFVFHFTNLKGGKGITDIGGIYGNKLGIAGKGIYTGTTSTPSWALKHIPFGGWGLDNAPVRIPIKVNADMNIVDPIIPFKTKLIKLDYLDFRGGS